MSLDYASATINNIPSKGQSAAVQDPIASNALPGSNAQQLNGQIGTAQSVAAPLSMFNPLVAQPSFTAAIGTPGLSNTGAAMTWCSLAGSTAVGTLGTISGAKVFTPGAGVAQAQAAGVAGGACWCKN